MGMAMALNLHRKGLQVCAHDIRPEATQSASAAGISVCASPAELAHQTNLKRLLRHYHNKNSVFNLYKQILIFV
jgi:6-phosphogluconate dehydrogenase (decarboxylating)